MLFEDRFKGKTLENPLNIAYNVKFFLKRQKKSWKWGWVVPQHPGLVLGSDPGHHGRDQRVQRAQVQRVERDRARGPRPA